MTRHERPTKNALACAAMLALVACGGGSSNNGGAGGDPNGSTPPPDNRPTTKLIDGPIAGATVFLDRNSNGLHDEGEPSATTDDGGIARWGVGTEELASAPLVALVGTSATDADHGPVTRAYVLSSPAGNPGVVSPLTTLVHRVMQQSGLGIERAEAALKSRTGIPSLLADYSSDTSAAGREAALSARVAVMQLQQQAERLAPQIGSPDTAGNPITAADIDQAALDSVVRDLPSLAQAARNGSLQGSCASIGSAECTTALQSLVVQQMDASGLTPSTLSTHAAAWRTTSPGALGEASLSLSEFIYGDANNWYWRAFLTSAQEATLDAEGHTHFRQVRRASSNGTVVEWGDGPTYARREDTHWNGSAWQTCPSTESMWTQPRDAQGLASDNAYCNAQHGANRRWSQDISGKNMLDVAMAMRAALPRTMGNWAAPAALQGAVFPAGARLLAQTSTSTATAPVYLPSAPVRLYSPEVAAGGDTRTNPSNACNTSETLGLPSFDATSLEMMIERLGGRPCTYRQEFLNSSASATPIPGPDPAEWWGNSTANIGQLGNAPVNANPTTFFTGNTLVNVAFDSASGTTRYYTCQQRQIVSSTRSCALAGTGSYSIETLGDARVLRLLAVPAVAALLDYERVYVERGGKVYAGYQSKPTHTAVFRLNLEATNAMFTQLGLPVLAP